MYNYNKQTVQQLRDHARSLGLKGYSRLRKDSLITLIKKRGSKTSKKSPKRKSSSKKKSVKRKSSSKKKSVKLKLASKKSNKAKQDFYLKLDVWGSERFIEYFLSDLGNYFENVRVVGDPSSHQVKVYLGKRLFEGGRDDDDLIGQLWCHYEADEDEGDNFGVMVIEPKAIQLKNIADQIKYVKKKLDRLIKEQSRIKKLKE